MDKGRIRNSRGQATLEAFFTIPTLIAGIFALAFLIWIGWLRFELSQMVQTLGACLNSTQLSSRCQSDFKQSLTKLPGVWQVKRIADNSNFTSVDLEYVLGRSRLSWSLDEPKAFRFRE